LPRYIATVETAKHRTFQFLDASVLPDNKLIAIASDDAAWLGVLSSQVHVEWALAAGSWLGVGNDPVYNKSRCFETFPFPHDDTGLTPELTDRIRHLAEQLDAHRKARQAAFESVTLTGLYNVLDKLRRGEALSPKEKVLHEQGLVSVLRSLHDELDAAVLAAYGWSDLGPVPWADEAARAVWTEAVLERLVALNARRAAEEAAGTIRWLRPDFQDPARRAEREAAAAQAARTPADGLLNQERLVTIPRWEQPDLGMKMAENEAPPASQVPEVPAEDATAHPGSPRARHRSPALARHPARAGARRRPAARRQPGPAAPAGHRGRLQGQRPLEKRPAPHPRHPGSPRPRPARGGGLAGVKGQGGARAQARGYSGAGGFWPGCKHGNPPVPAQCGRDGGIADGHAASECRDAGRHQGRQGGAEHGRVAGRSLISPDAQGAEGNQPVQVGQEARSALRPS
jgi:hypothetical protein